MSMMYDPKTSSAACSRRWSSDSDEKILPPADHGPTILKFPVRPTAVNNHIEAELPYEKPPKGAILTLDGDQALTGHQGLISRSWEQIEKFARVASQVVKTRLHEVWHGTPPGKTIGAHPYYKKEERKEQRF